MDLDDLRDEFLLNMSSTPSPSSPAPFPPTALRPPSAVSNRDVGAAASIQGQQAQGAAAPPGQENKKDEEPVESLQNIFRCFICMETLRDARMCPKCSKLCCSHCILRWLHTRPQCPHCRSRLFPQELVNCRWAEEVTQQLEQLDHLQLNLLNHLKKETEKCDTHVKEELSVFCETCGCCICHECALWSPTHTNHVFKPLDEIYLVHCNHVKNKMVHMRGRLLELMGMVGEMERKIDTLRHVKEQKVRDLKATVDNMIVGLDNQLKKKLVTLVNQKTTVNQKVEELETIMQEIEVMITRGPKSQIISASERWLQLMNETIRSTDFSIPPVTYEFHSEIVPFYEDLTFVVENYSQLRLKGDAIYSAPLIVNGLTWRLKIYPNGNGTVCGQSLSIFLELACGPPGSAKYEYRIVMIYQQGNDPSKNVVREFSSVFEVNECWGYNRFYRIDQLEHDGFLDTERDTLKFRFEVRNPSYFFKSKDQQWYISELEKRVEEQNHKIAELTNRVESLDIGGNYGAGDASSVQLRNDLEELFNSPMPSPIHPPNQDEERSRGTRAQKIQLLDLTDNNDTEEIVSEPENTENDSDIFEFDGDEHEEDNELHGANASIQPPEDEEESRGEGEDQGNGSM